MKFTLVLCAILCAQAVVFPQEGEKGKISGEAFIDYFYNIARDGSAGKLQNTAIKGAKDFNAFEFRRVTFTFDYNFSPKYQSRVRFEANQQSVSGSTVNTFVKDLSLRWKNIFERSDLILGLQPPPSFEVSENYWQYRSLEKTIMDLRGVASSRDMGIALKGRVDQDGILGYWIMFANNSNLGPETDKYKRAYAHINLSPANNINITVYADYKFRGKINVTNNMQSNLSSLNNDVVTFAAFGGIRDEDFSCGVEGFLQLTQNGYAYLNQNNTIFSTLNGYGISAFGNYEFLEDLSILGRFDYYDPNSKTASDSRNFFIFGLSFLAEKNIKIIPNVLIETFEKNQNISYDPSVTGRLTVHFVY